MNFEEFFQGMIKETQKVYNPKAISQEKEALRFGIFVDQSLFGVSRITVEAEDLATRLLEAVNLYRDLTYAHTGIAVNASAISTVSVLDVTFSTIEENTGINPRRLASLEDFLDAAITIVADIPVVASPVQKRAGFRRTIA